MSATAPSGPEWVHEIKHDGYRILARRDGARVCLWSRNGRNWSSAFPGIVRAIQALPAASVVLDGEAVAHCDEGLPDFHGLRSRFGGVGACFYAFDILMLGDRDLRPRPLMERKAALADLLRNTRPGLLVAERIEGDGPTIFRHACELGLEGIVSKRRDVRYRSGRDPNWLKIKNAGYERR